MDTRMSNDNWPMVGPYLDNSQKIYCSTQRRPYVSCQKKDLTLEKDSWKMMFYQDLKVKKREIIIYSCEIYQCKCFES